VDVEWIDPRRDLGALLPAFTPDERGALERIPDAERRAALFAAWTRKEARLKATGRGIGWGLAAGDRTAESARWTLVDIECGEDYRGTLAAEGSDWGVHILDSAES
jgi:4'-phosphopantetheinyl transferase